MDQKGSSLPATVTTNPAYAATFLVAVLGLLLGSLTIKAGASPFQPTVDFRWYRQLTIGLSSLRWDLGDRVFGQVVAGKQNWLFLADDATMQCYQRTTGLRTAVLTDMQQELDALDASLRARGATLVMIIPPDKSTIYGQYLPREIPVVDRPSRLDDFVGFMRAEGKTRIIDVRSALLAARDQHQLYYASDLHWNDYGAYFAYAELIKSLGPLFPDMQPVPLSEFVASEEQPKNGDLARMSGLGWYMEAGPTLTSRRPPSTTTEMFPLPAVQDMWFTHNSDRSLPRLLVFRDSFYFWMSKFVEPHFSESTVVHYNRLGDGLTVDDWIARTGPDVVVIETTENALTQILPMLKARH